MHSCSANLPWVSLTLQGKLAEQERIYAHGACKWRSRLEAEEDRATHISGHLQIDLTDKDNQVK